MKQEAPALVVADAGPLIGLAKASRLDLLRRLFRRVLVPEAVAGELRLDSDLPGATTLAAACSKGWLQVRPVAGVPMLLLAAVDHGEAEAIVLAQSENAHLLIDELCGRRAARGVGVRVFGTGAVLVMAKEAGLVPAVVPILEELLAANYRISPGVRRELLRLAGELDDTGDGDCPL